MFDLVALTLFMKARAAGVSFDTEFVTHPQLKAFCDSKFSVGWDGGLIADSLKNWFAYLDNSATYRARFLCEVTDISSLAFVGGAHWAPLVYLDDQWLIMHSRLQLNAETNLRDHQFGVFSYTTSDLPDAKPLPAAKEAIRASLDQMISVANEIGDPDMPHFVRRFEAGKEALDAPVSDSDPVHDFAPEGYGTEEQFQTLRAVLLSWPFGGMGWWTDRTIEDTEVAARAAEYANGLYASYCDALMSTCAV